MHTQLVRTTGDRGKFYSGVVVAAPVFPTQDAPELELNPVVLPPHPGITVAAGVAGTAGTRVVVVLRTQAPLTRLYKGPQVIDVLLPPAPPLLLAATGVTETSQVAADSLSESSKAETLK